jgi:hypothetical protein
VHRVYPTVLSPYHDRTTTTIVSWGIRRTIRASESPQSGYMCGLLWTGQNRPVRVQEPLDL